MPDSWEYPWYASWDLAFHAVALAHLDPAYAKSQLLLLVSRVVHAPQRPAPGLRMGLRRRQPARPGVGGDDRLADRHASQGRPRPATGHTTSWSACSTRCSSTSRGGSTERTPKGNNVFEGGFLGLDNIGLFDRSRPLPVPGVLEQSDGTAWMAMYCISLLEMALRLADHDPTYEDVAIKFYEHFAYIADAMHSQGLWDVDDGFFYDVIRFPDGSSLPVKVRSMVGVVPLLAVTTLHPALAAKLPDFMERTEWFEKNRPDLAAYIAHTRVPGMGDRRLLSVADRRGLADGCSGVSSTRRDALALRGAQPVALPPGAPFHPGDRRAIRRASTTNRRSRPRRSSAAIPTGAGRSGSLSTSSSSRPSTVTAGTSTTSSRWSTRWVGQPV